MSTKKQQTQQRIIAAAGKGIREHGYGGIGVDGIAKEAGVTSGAIYGNFGSKGKVFEATISAGMQDFVNGTTQWKEDKGEKWLTTFIDWYLSAERRQDIIGGCALPGLSADVARAEASVHQAYEIELNKLVESIAEGIASGSKAARKKVAWSLLSLLGGAVMMSRAVNDEQLANEIAASAKQNAKKLITGTL